MSIHKPQDLQQNMVVINDKRVIYQKKLEVNQGRIKYRKTNTMFEFYRGRYYIYLHESKSEPISVPKEAIGELWNSIWKKE